MPQTTAEQGIDALLKVAAFRADDVDHFLDDNFTTWAKFDPQFGYLLNSVAMKEGMDDACSFYIYEPAGHRLMLNYRDNPCRINTYGNSFTQCHQVSNGETWQEYLAANIGEPVRNYGIGGHGVWQAFNRARREEAINPADYVVLNIYDDDHVRNIDACRWIRMNHAADYRGFPSMMFHGNPWDHLRIDLDTGEWVERQSLAPTPETLRALADTDTFIETFRDDPIVKLFVLSKGGPVDDVADLKSLAAHFGVAGDITDPDTAALLHMTYALKSTEYVLDHMRRWIEAEGKKLMVLLSYGWPNVVKACEGESRFDQTLLDYLDRNNMLYVDTLRSHVDDYQTFNLDPKTYTERYYVGHYNPKGNHFFAFAIKNAVVNWLDPTPPSYRDQGDALSHLMATLA